MNIGKNARIPNFDTLGDACREPLAEKASKGIELFNNGRYFESHEELEDAWKEDDGPGRNLYRGILQTAVAYLQIERGNYRGAIKMLLRLRRWLDPLPHICRGVDVSQLRMDAQSVYDALTTLGPGRLDEFDRSLMRPVRRSG